MEKPIFTPQLWSFWMEQALELAQVAYHREEVPIAALLVHENGILASSFNQKETRQQVTAHAEILALENYSREFKAWRLPPNTTLVVTVEPCLMCASALLQARVKNIVYGCQDPKGAGLGLVEPWIYSGKFDHRIEEIIPGVLENECRELMTSFFEKRRLEKKLQINANI